MKTLLAIVIAAMFLTGCSTTHLQQEYATWPLKPYPLQAQNT